MWIILTFGLERVFFFSTENHCLYRSDIWIAESVDHSMWCFNCNVNGSDIWSTERQCDHKRLRSQQRAELSVTLDLSTLRSRSQSMRTVVPVAPAQGLALLPAAVAGDWRISTRGTGTGGPGGSPRSACWNMRAPDSEPKEGPVLHLSKKHAYTQKRKSEDFRPFPPRMCQVTQRYIRVRERDVLLVIIIFQKKFLVSVSLYAFKEKWLDQENAE